MPNRIIINTDIDAAYEAIIMLLYFRGKITREERQQQTHSTS